MDHGIPKPAFPLSSLRGDQAAADIAIATLVLMGFRVVTYLSGWPRLLNRWIPESWLIYAAAIAGGALCLLTIRLLLRFRGQHGPDIGLGRARAMHVALAVLACVPICFLAGAITNILVTTLSGRDFVAFARERTEFFNEMSGIPLVAVFPISIFVGIYEEILFRGFLLSRLRALAVNNTVPIIITSVLFGAGHYVQGFAGICQTAVIGLILAFMAVRLRTIWAGILTHAAIDAISLAMTVLFLPQIQKALHELTSAPAP